MPLEFKRNVAVFQGQVGVDEAETLLGWLQRHPAAVADLATCTHLHPANLQVMMAAALRVKAWPAEPVLRQWLQGALPNYANEKR